MKRLAPSFVAMMALSACNAVETAAPLHSQPRASNVAAGENVKVKAGDTVYGLARRYNVPMRDLIAVNNLFELFKLLIAQTIR